MIELNKCYCMDNLELMRQIDDSSIDLIYGDILYGTGRKFKDYQDLKPNKKVIEDFYIPRIKEMYRILKETGTIYLQMDYRINHWIRCIIDDIFNYENFRNEIIWCYSGGGRPKKDFAQKHDTILRYSKTNNYIFNEVRIPYTEGGGTDRALKSGKIMNKNIGKSINQWTPNEEGKIPEDWWQIPFINPMSKERVGYDTQKPKALLERIIKASSNEGDIVADFFCGSSTTGVAAKELNRKYILCDINKKAIDISEERLEKAIEG